MSGSVMIYGPTISTYGRIVAVVCEEVGQTYEIVATATGSAENRRRHPFLKSPAVEVDGLVLFETAAICQYLDDTRNAGGLQPKEPLARARMTQWLSVANSYVFPTTEAGLVLPRLVAPMTGKPIDETRIERTLPLIAYQLRVLNDRLKAVEFLAGDSVSLADLFLAVILRAVEFTGEGRALLRQLPSLDRWLGVMGARASVLHTAWPDEDVAIRRDASD